MRKSILAVGLLVFMGVAGAQQPKTGVTVTELPPEPFPVGTCVQDVSGYVGIPKAGKWEMHLTDKQLGEYLRIRLTQGYSVSLYPQVSGKIFAIATCESLKH